MASHVHKSMLIIAICIVDVHGLGLIFRGLREHIHEGPHMIQKLVHTKYFTYLCPLKPSQVFILVELSFHSSVFLHFSLTSLSLHCLPPSNGSTYLLTQSQCWTSALKPRRKCWSRDENLNTKNCFILAHMHVRTHTVFEHVNSTVYYVQSWAACQMWAILKFCFCMKLEIKWLGHFKVTFTHIEIELHEYLTYWG